MAVTAPEGRALSVISGSLFRPGTRNQERGRRALPWENQTGTRACLVAVTAPGKGRAGVISGSLFSSGLRTQEPLSRHTQRLRDVLA